MISLSRRSFLRGLAIASVAPAIVRADSLMRIVPRETAVLVWSDFDLAKYTADHAVPEFGEWVADLIDVTTFMDNQRQYIVGGYRRIN